LSRLGYRPLGEEQRSATEKPDFVSAKFFQCDQNGTDSILISGDESEDGSVAERRLREVRAESGGHTQINRGAAFPVGLDEHSVHAT
jgi:hypothetical protein